VGGAATGGDAAGQEGLRGPREVIIRDDCDPNDPAWGATGGCTLPGGSVTNAEFGQQRLSPTLAPTTVIGHLAWWFDPNYLKVDAGKKIRVRNEGGRVHTFTKVAAFGGGRVPPLNQAPPGTTSLTPAPECLAPGVVDLAAGARDEIDGLSPGEHKYQCCIHPWMRTHIKVLP
jgi:plastocyanin